MNSILLFSVKESPNAIDYFSSVFVEIITKIGDECEPVESALVGKGLLKGLQFELFKEDAILIECLHMSCVYFFEVSMGDPS